MHKTRITGTFLLPSLACSYSYPELLQSDSAHRFKGYHWVTGRSSIGICSVHLGTVYQSPLNMISRPRAHEDHLAFFSWVTPLPVGQGLLPLPRPAEGWILSLDTMLPPMPQAEQGLRHNVSSCSEEKRKVGELVAIRRHPTNVTLQGCQVSPCSS